MASRAVMVAVLVAAVAATCARAQLHEKFYGESCPSVEDVVRKEMVRALSLAPSLAGPLLRMHFHDCFVRGCDGSVLLDSANKTAEKDAKPNQTLRGFNFVEKVKTANFTVLTQLFAAKNLDSKDLVVLSAGHTIGTSHCFSFSDRLYNFTGRVNPTDIDHTLEPQYMAKLRNKCTSLNDNTTLVEMDPGSFRTFDLAYFKNVVKRRGLFHSDGALLTNAFTRAYVERHAGGGYKEEFFADFAASMIKMGNADVLTGSQGEIRKKCNVPNH
ncbi:unnamed protein product [Triticum turgidum subsp. durum]|uniref:Plant heme peroxidase family profile domain-containing protein n=1 Tax=Triticum turgidum subsp. durum TaxID=4567 RepID=A0A9R0VAB9_TRITD|nr:unnamed protein product [Triticum turgidum subsp. durum]